MENNKDNYKGQQPNIMFDFKNTNFFKGDEYALFLYKKTEKLVAAVYLVTNLFNENEPMRHHLRELGLSLMSNILAFVGPGVSDKEYLLGHISESILETSSSLEVAFFAGHVSEMNYRILKREFLTTFEMIEKKEKYEKEKNGFVLSDTFFKSEENYTLPSKEVVSTSATANDLMKGQQKGQAETYNKNGGHNTTKNPKPIVKDIAERKDSRKSIILNLLKKENNLTIKDFSKVIPDCSEKTIQRELLQLVSEGVLKKEGERRWSKYSLNR